MQSLGVEKNSAYKVKETITIKENVSEKQPAGQQESAQVIDTKKKKKSTMGTVIIHDHTCDSAC